MNLLDSHRCRDRGACGFVLTPDSDITLEESTRPYGARDSGWRGTPGFSRGYFRKSLRDKRFPCARDKRFPWVRDKRFPCGRMTDSVETHGFIHMGGSKTHA